MVFINFIIILIDSLLKHLLILNLHSLVYLRFRSLPILLNWYSFSNSRFNWAFIHFIIIADILYVVIGHITKRLLIIVPKLIMLHFLCLNMRVVSVMLTYFASALFRAH